MSIDNKLEDPERRKFFGLAGKIAALGMAYPIMSAAESLVGGNNVEAAERYSDSDYLRMMNQPVEETLKGTDVVYVDDSNYQKEVFGSDKPVMVLFAPDNKDFKGVHGARGLSTLARVLHEQFPEIKFVAYDNPDFKLDDDGKMGYAKFAKFQDKYPLKSMPALLFYDNDNGKIEFMGDAWTSTGINKLETIKKGIASYKNYIPSGLLD